MVGGRPTGESCTTRTHALDTRDPHVTVPDRDTAARLRASDTDLATVHAQMVVFARELGELYSAERVAEP